VTERVRIKDGTTFKNGTRDDIVLNARLEASGALRNDGTLVANEVEFLGTTP
jgi:hypothetical protein